MTRPHSLLVRVLLGAAFAAALVAAPRADLAADDQTLPRLAEIKGLYESAEYENALAVVARVSPATLTPGEARDIDVYEALCLLALGNKPEAAKAIGTVILADPLYEPSADFPNRLRALVDEVRDQLRPRLVQARYRSGRELFAAARYDEAAREFALVLQLTEGRGDDAAAEFADIRVLASSFYDQSTRALATAAETADIARPPAAPSRPPADDPVTAPITIRQDVPPCPPSLAEVLMRGGPGVLNGVIDVVISPEGKVGAVRVIKGIHPIYDSLLIAAASRWKYQPATRSGTPVEYVKRISITVR